MWVKSFLNRCKFILANSTVILAYCLLIYILYYVRVPHVHMFLIQTNGNNFINNVSLCETKHILVNPCSKWIKSSTLELKLGDTQEMAFIFRIFWQVIENIRC